MSEPHAITRARERHGVELTIRDLNEITGMIERGESLRQGYLGRGAEQHIVMLRGFVLPVVFLPRDRAVITVLPTFKLRKNRV